MATRSRTCHPKRSFYLGSNVDHHRRCRRGRKGPEVLDQIDQMADLGLDRGGIQAAPNFGQLYPKLEGEQGLAELVEQQGRPMPQFSKFGLT
jgi:hypothetical protein